jgi:hypothetical protein
MTAKEFIAHLQTDKPFRAWVNVTKDDGYYIKQNKSEWIKYLKDSDKNNDLDYDVSVSEGKMYLN